MSYILEALRKSERQRRELEAQPLVRLAAYPTEIAHRRWRPVVMIVLVVINVAALLFLLRYLAGREAPANRPSAAPAAMAVPDDQGTASRVAADALSADSAAPTVAELGFAAAPAARKPLAMVKETPAVPLRKPREASSALRTVAPSHRSPEPATLARTTPGERGADVAPDDGEARDEAVPVRRPRPLQKGKAATNPTPRMPGPARKGVALSELPVPNTVVDDSLPRPKINVYAYSATGNRDRFVVIRGRKYHEGDRLEDGPAIRRIEETAVTLDFEGQTYKVPRP